MTQPKAWQTYEEVATDLLNSSAKEFRLKFVEGKQEVQGTSGALWEIDAKGVREDNDAIVIVECRRHTKSPLNNLAALRTFSLTCDERGLFPHPYFGRRSKQEA